MGRLNNRFASWLLLYLGIGLFLAPAALYAGDEPELYGGAESFAWREYDVTGQIVKESGPRYLLGFTNTHEFPNHMTLKPRVEFFGGNVDYSGEACDNSGNCVPASSDTDYFGVKLELDLGVRLRPLESFIIEPFAGLGIREWSRQINSSLLADGSYAVGYTEDWTTFYGRLGLRAEQRLAGPNKLFLEAGLKLPVSTTNYIDDRNVSYESITLHPGNRPSPFAELGAKLDVFRISVYYDSMRFKQSDVVAQYDPYEDAVIGYYQPKSSADMYGIRLGVAFY